MMNVSPEARRGTFVIIAGAVLLTAATLKAYQLAFEPGSPQPSRAWTIVHGIFEVGLGAFLIIGTAPQLINCVTIATFGVFACVALYRAALGLPTCGCFGMLSVPPLYTAILDLSVVFGLARFSPPTSSFRARRGRIVLACVVLLAFAGVGVRAPWIRASARAAVDATGVVTGAGSMVVLEPQKWLDARWPLLPHIDVAQKLAWESRTILLYHHDCATCREVMLDYERRARESSEQIALIEMPPYAPPGESPVSPSSPCLLGKVSDKHEWFAVTPVVLTLVDGRVVSALQGEEAVAHAPR